MEPPSDFGSLLGQRPRLQHGGGGRIPPSGGGLADLKSTTQLPPAANTNNPSVPQPKTFLERFTASTEGMSRPEILQSEPLWAGARSLVENNGMSLENAFRLLVSQRTGYPLTSSEWQDIATQAMKYGIR